MFNKMVKSGNSLQLFDNFEIFIKALYGMLVAVHNLQKRFRGVLSGIGQNVWELGIKIIENN